MIHLSGWVAPTRNLQLLHPLAVQRQPCTVTGQAMKCYSHHWACHEYTYTSCVTSLTCIINETHNIHWNFTFRMIHSITGTSQHITSDSLLIITLTLGSCSWQLADPGCDVGASFGGLGPGLPRGLDEEAYHGGAGAKDHVGQHAATWQKWQL